MQFSITLFCSFSFIATVAPTKPDNYKPSCPYNKTVDLTNHTPFRNNSYVYQGVVIPLENQSFYDYKLFFGREKESVKRHRRGCVCENPKFCMKLCCETDKFYNVTSFKCEHFEIPREFKWELKIRLNNLVDKTVNIFRQFIYQVGVPCAEPEALLSDKNKWDLREDGRLNMLDSDANLDTVDYCFTPYKVNETQEHVLMALSCPMKHPITLTLIINTYAMTISVVFFIPSIVVYLMIKELRENLRGQILICYLISMTIAYSIISYINISQTIIDNIPCSILGFVAYFCFMSAYFWLSVLCYDIWINFRKPNVDSNSRNDKKLFIYYSLAAWSASAVFTGMTLAAQLSPIIDEKYKPGIGVKLCWLDTRKWSAAIYFYGPNLVISLANIITFVYLTVHIYVIRRDSAKMKSNDRPHENFIVIFRLFLVMGIPWIFDIISYTLPEAIQSAFIVSDLVNALQGPLIFTLFVLKANVLSLLKKRFSHKPKKCGRFSSTKSTALETSTAL